MTQTDRIAMVRQYLKHFDLAIDQSSLDAEDKAMARHEDRQGLGLTRRA
jgi:predicted AAA+ superfamily ATPase